MVRGGGGSAVAVPARRRLVRRPAAQEEGQRRHRDEADDGDHAIGEAPALGRQGGLHGERPDRAGQIVAAGGGRHRDAAPSGEPVRYVGDQRPEGRGRSEADDRLHHRIDEERRRHRAHRMADDQAGGRKQHRRDDAGAVDRCGRSRHCRAQSRSWSSCRAARRRRARRRIRPGPPAAPRPPTTCRPIRSWRSGRTAPAGSRHSGHRCRDGTGVHGRARSSQARSSTGPTDWSRQ